MKAACFALVVALPACAAAPTRFEYSRGAMGTDFRLVLYAEERARADAAAHAAFDRIDELEARLSDWRDDSEVADLARRSAAAARSGPIPVSDDLRRVLAVAQAISAKSGGAFDVTVGPMVQLWRRARRQETLPSDAALAAARSSSGTQNLRLDPAASTVEFLVRGMRLDFGGIAKGYAADAALAVLAERGIACALMVAGGDVAAGAPPPGEPGWLVALAELDGAQARLAIRVAHAAVSTSGDTYRFVEIGGRRFSHIVDPRTGLGLEQRMLVCTLARDGATADALATAVSVVGAERGIALIESIPGVAVRIVTSRAGATEACASSGWPPMMPAPSSE